MSLRVRKWAGITALLLSAAVVAVGIWLSHSLSAHADTPTYCHQDGTCGWPNPDTPGQASADGGNSGSDEEVVPQIFQTHAECVAYFVKNYGDRLGEIESWNCEERNGRYILRIKWWPRKPQPSPTSISPVVPMPPKEKCPVLPGQVVPQMPDGPVITLPQPGTGC
jgi:hypothetical protein